MTDWQVTATTIYCDAVDDDVTVMVYKDGSSMCTGYRKYVENGTPETEAVLKGKGGKKGEPLKCEGPLDYRVTGYRDALFAGEKPVPL